VNVSERDPSVIAARLGISESAVRRLLARGILRQFDLGRDEVRRRLWLGHQLYLQRLVTARQIDAITPALPTARNSEPEHVVHLDRHSGEPALAVEEVANKAAMKNSTMRKSVRRRGGPWLRSRRPAGGTCEHRSEAQGANPRPPA